MNTERKGGSISDLPNSVFVKCSRNSLALATS